MNKDIAHIGTYGVILQRLFKLREKIIRYDSHHNFLSQCLAKGLIPNGFYLKWTMNLGISDQSNDYMEHILQETSRKLLTKV
jgi:hypothetical protein